MDQEIQALVILKHSICGYTALWRHSPDLVLGCSSWQAPISFVFLFSLQVVVRREAASFEAQFRSCAECPNGALSRCPGTVELSLSCVLVLFQNGICLLGYLWSYVPVHLLSIGI